MTTTALLPAALLLLLLLFSGFPAAYSDQIPITVQVANNITHSPTRTYSTYVAFRGILIGGLKRLQDSNTGFHFTYTEDPNYGPYLLSVNSLAESTQKHTYWELLVKKTNDQIIRPDVGIGCYIPSGNDIIILNYTKY